METFTIYGRPGCGYCSGAKEVLDSKGLNYDYIDIWERDISKEEVAEITGHPAHTVPQIMHGERYIGGFSELMMYLRRGL